MKLTYRARTGHDRTRFTKKNSNGQATDRRKSALSRLELQLKSGTKTEKKTGKTIELDEKDVKRINKEIEIIKNRI